MQGEQFHIFWQRMPFLCVVFHLHAMRALKQKNSPPCWPRNYHTCDRAHRLVCSHLHSTKRGTDRICMHVQGSVKAEQVCLAGVLSFSESSRSSHWHSPVTDQVLHCLWCLKELPSTPLRWRKPKLATFITLANSNIWDDCTEYRPLVSTTGKWTKPLLGYRPSGK